VIGLAYAALLPFIGIARLLKLIGQKIGGSAMEAVMGKAHSDGGRANLTLPAKRKTPIKGIIYKLHASNKNTVFGKPGPFSTVQQFLNLCGIISRQLTVSIPAYICESFAVGLSIGLYKM
jgi:hypothetical protein